MEICVRCGQDSDCNPASAGGILGTMMGYDNIPEYWKSPLYPVEDMEFKYTTMSLNDVYSIGTKHAMEILRHHVKLRVQNSGKGYHVRVDDLLIYGLTEVKNAWE